MQIAVGECIRQIRRQRSLTQTELGGERFSKSYVSAVERDKISPSHEALRFFAEQLEQPVEYFERLLHQSDQIGSVSILPGSYFYQQDEAHGHEQDEIMSLLDLVLEGTELRHTPFSQEIFALSSEAMMALPLQKQARYFFLKGMVKQEESDFKNARQSLEHALALSPIKHQPAILDTLGVNHYQEEAYQTALSYHIRALHLLDQEQGMEKNPALLFNVELHCGNDYRALGANTAACEYYERARQYLRSSNNMQVAGQLYLGLGYCTYASLYQESKSLHNPLVTWSYEEKERLFQRAVSFLVQSRTLYQVSSDRLGESHARLLHAIILLDFCNLRRSVALRRLQETGVVGSIQCATLLDEAEEQCRQILVSWNTVDESDGPLSSELEIVLYGALSHLVRVLIQRAAVARLEGYGDTAVRERSSAAHLCQLVLNTLGETEFPWTLVRNAVSLSDNVGGYSFQSLPRLPNLANGGVRNSMSLAEVYFAAAEVAEELGRSATTVEYADDCYPRADESFKAALNMERQSMPYKEHDPSYLTRSYQRCVALLEERIQVSPFASVGTYNTLLSILKDGLYQVQYPVLPLY